MTKSIHTLVKDINEVIETGGGWDATLSKYAAELMEGVFNTRLGGDREEFSPALRLSALGTPCKRKLWYSVNQPDEVEALPTAARFKFLYGDILEQLLIVLAIAAGHRVEGTQDVLEVGGVKGHRDCVIDGITVDIKSASSYGYKKFASGGLREDDPFGYISQLSSYVYGGRDSHIESHPSLGAFLVVDKQNGFICLDMYDFGPELDGKLEEVESLKTMVAGPIPPRGFEEEPEGKSGNMKLPMACSYCSNKYSCWDKIREYRYARGPVYLTKVVKEPNVPEVQR